MTTRVVKKFMTNYVLILTVLCLFVGGAVDGRSAKNETERITDTVPFAYSTYIKDINDEQAKLFQNLIYILNELHYFNTDGNKSGCFLLKQIDRDVNRSKTDSNQIGIHLFFDEHDASIDSSLFLAQNMKATKSDSFSNRRIVAGDCSNMPVVFQDTQGLPGLGRMSRKQIEANKGDPKMMNGTTKENDQIAPIPQAVDEQGGRDDIQKGKFSNTACN